MMMFCSYRFLLAIGLISQLLCSGKASAAGAQKIYYLRSTTEGIYNIRNPFNDFNVKVVSVDGEYKPYIDSVTNHLYLYCKANSTYQIQTRTESVFTRPISIVQDEVIQEKGIFMYDIISQFSNDHWLTRLLRAQEAYKQEVSIGNLKTPGKIKFYLYNFGDGPSNVRFKFDSFSYDTLINNYGDFSCEFRIPISSNSKIELSVDCENNDLGIVKILFDLNRYEVDYNYDFKVYNIRQSKNFIKAQYNPEYEYFFMDEDAVLQKLSLDTLNPNFLFGIQSLIVQRRNQIKEAYPKLVDKLSVPKGMKMIIIGHERFNSYSDEIISLVKVINPDISAVWISSQDIYNDNNYSQKSPESLKNFILKLDPLPEYVMLVGDAHITGDMNDDLIPTFYYTNKVINTKAPCDYLYSYTSNPKAPLFSISRLPVKDISDLQNYRSKILAYLRTHGKDRVLISNVKNSAVSRFISSNNSEMYDEGKLVSDRDWRQFFNRKHQTLIFLGHGSFSGWEMKRKITIDDFNKFKIAASFVLLDFSCWTGEFSHGGRRCFSEELLFSKENGPVAVVSASNFISLDSYSYTMDLLSTTQDETVGRFLTAVKTDLSNKNQFTTDDRHFINLLGIPILKI